MSNRHVPGYKSKPCLATGKVVKGHSRNNCRACRCEYNKSFNKTEKGIAVTKRHFKNVQMNENQYGAMKLLSVEIRAGRLKKASEFKCYLCGVQAQCYDHRDYSKPLDVKPVCRKCNYKLGPGINKKGNFKSAGNSNSNKGLSFKD